MAATPIMAGWLFLALIGIAVVVGIIIVVRASVTGSGRSVGLIFAALVVAGVLLGFIGVRTTHVIGPPVAVEVQHGSHAHDQYGENKLSGPRIVMPRVEPNPAVKTTEHEHEPPATPGTAAENLNLKPNPNPKPAWLTQGTQTGNGESQFPVSSELFATVAECQRDLDSRMPALVAEELRFLIGQEFPIPFTLAEVKMLTAETYTEDVPTTSQGNWYKVHRLVKVDNIAWAKIQERFQHALSEGRLRSLGFSFGGLMLVIGVVYLVLRRTPRVVDPTKNTFSTT